MGEIQARDPRAQGKEIGGKNTGTTAGIQDALSPGRTQKIPNQISFKFFYQSADGGFKPAVIFIRPEVKEFFFVLSVHHFHARPSMVHGLKTG